MTTDPQIISAVPSPFDTDGTLDLTSLRRNLERLDPLVDGVFAAGTPHDLKGSSARIARYYRARER